VRWTVGWTD